MFFSGNRMVKKTFSLFFLFYSLFFYLRNMAGEKIISFYKMASSFGRGPPSDSPPVFFSPDLPSLICFGVCIFFCQHTQKSPSPLPPPRPASPSPQQVTFENLMSFMVFHGNILSAGCSPRRCSMIKTPPVRRSALSHAHLEKLYVLLGGLKWSRRLTFPGRPVARVCKNKTRWLAATRNAHGLPINPRLRYQSISRSLVLGVGGRGGGLGWVM